MQVGMYYWKTCVSGSCHVFRENVLWKDMCMSCRSVQKQPFRLL